MKVIDADSHIHETRTTWLDYIDPGSREDALRIEDDELGYAWLTCGGRRIYLAEVQHPGHVAALGEGRSALRRGEPAAINFDDALRPEYHDPAARVAWLDQHQLDATVLFPNYGLLWENQLEPVARNANLAAYNRYAIELAEQGRGRLFPAGHLNLEDREWAVAEIGRLGAGGVRLAMIGPSPVNDVPLWDRSMDPIWRAFVDNEVAPTFHVGAHRRPLDPAWYAGDPESVNTVLDIVLLWTAPAAALTGLSVFGTFERFPDLRIGVVELTAGWVPAWMLMLDGGVGFRNMIVGEPVAKLQQQPSDYIRDNVRISAMAYEQPGQLMEQAGNIFMFGSDWPHSEGIAKPREDYEAINTDVVGDNWDLLYGGNISWLLRL